MTFITLRSLLPLLGLVFIQTTLADTCQPHKIQNWAKADYATSGDELIIERQRYKLIGIEAPQIEKKQKFFTAGQPLAKEAQTYLNKLLANHELMVGIEYDSQLKDRFGRRLVHLYFKNKQGQIESIQQSLLHSGMALAATQPPNLKHQKCYFEAEKSARQQASGVWQLTETQPKLHFPLVNSSQIYAEDTGYRIIRGKVVKIEQSSHNYIINLDTTGIRIQKKDWGQFNLYKIRSLLNQEIEVRGFPFHYKGAMFVVIRHPNAIDQLRQPKK